MFEGLKKIVRRLSGADYDEEMAKLKKEEAEEESRPQERHPQSLGEIKDRDMRKQEAMARQHEEEIAEAEAKTAELKAGIAGMKKSGEKTGEAKKQLKKVQESAAQQKKALKKEVEEMVELSPEEKEASEKTREELMNTPEGIRAHSRNLWRMKRPLAERKGILAVSAPGVGETVDIVDLVKSFVKNIKEMPESLRAQRAINEELEMMHDDESTMAEAVKEDYDYLRRAVDNEVLEQLPSKYVKTYEQRKVASFDGDDADTKQYVQEMAKALSKTGFNGKEFVKRVNIWRENKAELNRLREERVEMDRLLAEAKEKAEELHTKETYAGARGYRGPAAGRREVTDTGISGSEQQMARRGAAVGGRARMEAPELSPKEAMADLDKKVTSALTEYQDLMDEVRAGKYDLKEVTTESLQEEAERLNELRNQLENASALKNTKAYQEVDRKLSETQALLRELITEKTPTKESISAKRVAEGRRRYEADQAKLRAEREAGFAAKAEADRAAAAKNAEAEQKKSVTQVRRRNIVVGEPSDAETLAAEIKAASEHFGRENANRLWELLTKKIGEMKEQADASETAKEELDQLSSMLNGASDLALAYIIRLSKAEQVKGKKTDQLDVQLDDLNMILGLSAEEINAAVHPSTVTKVARKVRRVDNG